ncbi:MAG: hypothetical protein SGILL_008453, partial [Bacillariaceae sp.]
MSDESDLPTAPANKEIVDIEAGVSADLSTNPPDGETPILPQSILRHPATAKNATIQPASGVKKAVSFEDETQNGEQPVMLPRNDQND